MGGLIIFCNVLNDNNIKGKFKIFGMSNIAVVF